MGRVVLAEPLMRKEEDASRPLKGIKVPELTRVLPVPLTVQALDHGAGYLLAAATVRGLTLRKTRGRGSRWRTSLARVGGFLAEWQQGQIVAQIGKPESSDYSDVIEQTAWGPALRLRSPLRLGDAVMRWEKPAGELGASPAAW